MAAKDAIDLLLESMVAARKVASGGKDWTNIDTELRHEGKQIVLPAEPANMEIPVAIETLARIEKAENQKFDVNEVVVGGPWDALVAIYNAMQDIYGVVMPESRKTWFGEIKPDFITVRTGAGPKDVVQVPAGQMSLPGVSDPVQVGLHPQGAYIMGNVKKKDRARLVDIANKARELLKTSSVYRGKSIRIGVDDDGNLNLHQQPEFIGLSRVKETDMIHTAETDALIKTNIFSPLKHTQACRDNRIPLKRGILLEGKYGTGKSLTARVTAKVANDNGWTFVMLDRALGLRAAIEFARTYQPCVIFAEDIDRAADREDESVNDLVNLIDGVISKDMEIMVVLTTNFIDKIDRALLRPGRFDAVISIQTPDADTAIRLVKAYARELLADDADLSEVGSLLDGQIPATIREVVERAKLSMLMEERGHLTVADLSTSAIGMKRHMELLDPPVIEETPAEKLYNAFKGMLVKAAGGVDGDEIAVAIEDAKDEVISEVQDVYSMARQSREASQSAGGSATRAADLVQRLTETVEKQKRA